MKNKGFTLIEIMVVTGISMGLAAIIFSIFILMNTGFMKTSMHSNLKQQAQIALDSSQNYMEKAISGTINISACQQGECQGNKITFQVPVVTQDAVAGTVFTNLGELKRGAYYMAANGNTNMIKDGYFDIYASNKKLIVDVWEWRNSGGGGGGGGCFLAGTPILLADGSTKPIEEIKPKDKILGFNEKTNKTQEDEVAKLLVRKAKKYLIINGRVKVTSEHPFYHEGKWVKIGSLKIGDKLLNNKNQVEVIKSIEKVNQEVTVYNLIAKPSHTYFAYGILVHNKGSNQSAVGGGPWGKLFNDMLGIKEAWAATVKFKLNTKVIADKVIEANFITDASAKLITIKLKLENKPGLSGEMITYETESQVAPLN
jgi:type II secretory pathway pseudopilin PulG